MATTEKMAALTMRVGNNAVAYAITTLAAEQHCSIEGEGGTPRHMECTN